MIDFRYRPPYKSYKDAIMYRDLERTKNNSAAFGMHVSKAVLDLDFDASIKEMDAAGITMGVLAGRKVLPHIGIIDNQDIAELVRDYPGRFIGLAGVDPTEMDEAMAEIEKWVDKGGMHGVVVEPGLTKRPMYIEDRELAPIYEECIRLDVPVMLMVGSNCGPDISYSEPKHVEALAKAYPKLRIILAHGGWPWVTETIHLAYRYKNIYLLPDLYAFNAPGSSEFLAAANYILREKVLFGSAYPFVDMSEAVEYFKNGRILPEAESSFFEENARRVLGLN